MSKTTNNPTNGLEKLSRSFEQTLKDSDLQDVTSNLAETFSDTLLSDGILRDIPILGTIIGLTKASMSLSERLLIKKLIYFLSELQEVEPEKRQMLIESIEQSDKQKINIGEKLLYIIDKSEDHNSARYVAALFACFLREEITYSVFLRGSTIIQKMFIEDLQEFIEIEDKKLERRLSQWDDGLSDFENSLITVGICATYIDPVSVRDQDDYKRSDKYVVEGGDQRVYITEIGHVLKTYLA